MGRCSQLPRCFILMGPLLCITCPAITDNPYPLFCHTQSQGLFAFMPSARPVPLECHMQGYPSRFYSPRMASMNRPAYVAIQTHAQSRPVRVVFWPADTRSGAWAEGQGDPPW